MGLDVQAGSVAPDSIQTYAEQALTIAQAAEAGGVDFWEAAVALGISVRVYGDLHRVVLGSLCLSIDRGYSRDGLPSRIEEFAQSIGMADSVSSLYTYRRLVQRVGFLECVEYIGKGVSYSAMRAALTLKEPELIREDIEKRAGLRDLEDGEALPTYEHKRPKPLVDARGTSIRRVGNDSLEVRLGVDLLHALTGKDKVRVVIYDDE
jgi:hypothetical protein